MDSSSSSSHGCASKEANSKDSAIGKSSSEQSSALNRNQTASALGNTALVESIRGIYSSTAVPPKLASTKEFTSLGFTFNPTHYQHGYYSKFYRAQNKNQEKIILKTLQLNKLKSMYKSQTIDESCKILEYMGKKEKVPHVVQLYGQFLVGDTLHIFMAYYSERSIHYKMRSVALFSEDLIRQWTRQLGAVCKFMQERGIVHRSIRLEHLLLDQRENLYLTGFTRAIFLLNPHNFQLNKCNREFQCRKKNHLPPESFVGSKHSPVQIDQWSLGVIIASLSTSRHPFNPKLLTLVGFEQQWQEFVAKHGAKMNPAVVAALNRLFVRQENERIHLNELLNIEFMAHPEKKSVKKKSPTKVKPSGVVVRSTVATHSVAHPEGGAKSSKKAKAEVNPTSGPKKSSKVKSKKAAPKSTKKSSKGKSVAPEEKSAKQDKVQKSQDAKTSTTDTTNQPPGMSEAEAVKSERKHQEVKKEIDKTARSSAHDDGGGGGGGEPLHKSNSEVPEGK